MNNKISLLDEVKEHFKSFKFPNNILNDKCLITYKSNDIYKDIIKDYKIDRNKLSKSKCSMIICDLELLSDEFVLYLMPNIFEYLLTEKSSILLLKNRIIQIDFEVLSKDDKKILDKILLELEDIEEQLDNLTELEIKIGEKQWKENRLKKGTVNDNFLIAVFENNIPEMKKLIDKGADIFYQDENGNNAFNLPTNNEVENYLNKKKFSISLIFKHLISYL